VDEYVSETRTGVYEWPIRLPVSTYRVQLQPAFGFRELTAILPYLEALGVTECYCSPYFKARPGSTHGYDIGDHNALNPELGSQDDFDALVGRLAAHRLGVLLDFVPNHMGIDPRTNPWWRDVLENGPSSRFASYFDIDWEPIKTELRTKVLLPILSQQYGEALENGEIRLSFVSGALVLNYQDRELPTNARESVTVLRHGVDSLAGEHGEDPDVQELLSIITQLQNLPVYTDRRPERAEERRRETTIARGRLVRLTGRSSRVREHIERAIDVFNGRRGTPDSFDLLHEFLERQPYRLAYWRTSAHEINYRRFFDIDDLAGLRMELPEVFEATHQLLSRLIATSAVTGVRIDHPDGLFAPAAYFQRLQALAARSLGVSGGDPGGGDSRAAPLYVVIEKILMPGQHLPQDWQVHGTTGYSFMNTLNGLFVSTDHAKAFREFATRVTGHREPFADVVYVSKKLIMETALASELNVLANSLNRISEQHRRSRDFTLNSLRSALMAFIASLPVYRTYVDQDGVGRGDRETIASAVAHARRRNPALESSIFDFLLDVLCPRRPGETGHADRKSAERRSGYPPLAEADHRERIRFAMRLQQYTGPVHAKGVEDTAFYRYNVLLSLSEVGGNPGRFGIHPAVFHRENALRLDRWPLELLATATHDSKLGEDVRARLNVLSELPDEWRRNVRLWMRTNADNRTQLGPEWAPDRNDEYRFYQVLVGVWPADHGRTGSDPLPDLLVERLRAYMLKAAKEAKVHTSWIQDNERYDAALVRFVERTLTGPTFPRFVELFAPFARFVARVGMVNSLAQVLMKVVSPGVPDFYQGAELWDLNLVDPDNRRPVDYSQRVAWLQALGPLLDGAPGCEGAVRLAAVRQLLEGWEDGRIKLWLTAALLRLRRRAPDLFLKGEYVPLDADLAVPGGLVAFARRAGGRVAIAIAPRLIAALVPPQGLPIGPSVWRTSRVRLPAGLAGAPYENVITGEIVRPLSSDGESWILVGEALAACPVALLVRES
jgi:(1->4)-alpha-D-glucan 1-alpha-D-glucosylmutase